MGDFSFGHIILLVIVGIIVYGKDLPQAARKLAIMYNKFRRQIADIKDEIQRQIPMDEIKNELNQVQSGFDPMAPQVEIPMSPTSVIAQVADAGKVIVTWNSVPGATTYNLKRATSSVDPLLIVAMNLTDLSYADSGLEPGKTYHYVVTAQNSAGESGSSEEGVVTLPAEIPTSPPPVAASPAEAPAPGSAPPPAPEAAPAPGGNGEIPSPQSASKPEAPPAA
jgi:Sec-independent protein translocase protein TatA